MKGFKTVFGIDHFTDAIETALNLPGIDLVALAQGMGVDATRAAPMLIDVPVVALRDVGPV
jgi:hypothetical protein